MMSGADEEATMLSTACNQILGTILAFAHHIPLSYHDILV